MIWPVPGKENIQSSGNVLKYGTETTAVIRESKVHRDHLTYHTCDDLPLHGLAEHRYHQLDRTNTEAPDPAEQIDTLPPPVASPYVLIKKRWLARNVLSARQWGRR